MDGFKHEVVDLFASGVQTARQLADDPRLDLSTLTR